MQKIGIKAIFVVLFIASLLSCKSYEQREGAPAFTMMVQLDDSINAVDLAWGPGGDYYATGTAAGEIKLWTRDGRLLKSFKVGSRVHALAISPDGMVIAHHAKELKGSYLVLRNLEGGVIKSVPADIEPRGILFAPGGTFVACMGRTGVTIAESGGKQVRTLRAPVGRKLEKISFFSEGRKIAAVLSHYLGKNHPEFTSGVSHTIATLLWNLDGTSVREVKDKALFSPDGVTLASPDASGRVLTILDENLTVKETIRLSEKIFMNGNARGLPYLYPVFTPDGGRLAFAVENKKGHPLAVICGRDGKILHRFSPSPYAGLPMVSFSPDGGRLAWWGESLNYDRLRMFDVASGTLAASAGEPDISSTPLGQPPYHQGSGITVMDDGKKMVELRLRRVLAWDLSAGALAWSRHTGHDEIDSRKPWISPDSRRVLFGGVDTRFIKHTGKFSARMLDAKGEFVAVSTQYSTEGPINEFDGTAFSPDGNVIANRHGSQLKIWTRNGKHALSIPLTRKMIREFRIGGDFKSFGTVSDDGEVTIGNLEGAIKKTFRVEPFDLARFSPDMKKLFTTGSGTGKTSCFGLRAYETETGRIIPCHLSGHCYTNRIIDMKTLFVNRDGTRALSAGRVGADMEIQLFNTDCDREKTPSTYWLHRQMNSHWGEGRFDTYFTFSSDEKSIISFAWRQRHVNLWDLDGNHLKKIEEPGGFVLGADHTPDGRYLLVRTGNFTTRMLNIETDSSCYFTENGGEWIVYTPDGYFDGSPGCGRLIAMVSGMKAYGVEQFALKFNRPDIILRRMGLGTQGIIDHFHGRFLRRLRKAGMSESDLSGELQVPTAVIEKIKQDFSADGGRVAELRFTIEDPRHPLASYNIYVNEVPLFGEGGKPAAGREKTITEEIELGTGRSKIEVTCRNRRGAESLRAMAYAEYNRPVKGDLYFIGFGVSKYRDASLDLNYAHKDALDLSRVFGKMGSLYEKVHSKTFLDGEVTADAIRRSGELLKDAKVDDTVVLFVGGHGVYDTGRDAAYYYLTHDTDINNLKGTAADFDLLEDLFDGIAPRNRIFLMDTCESGEYEDGMSIELPKEGSRGVRPRTTRALAITLKKNREKGAGDISFTKDRYIYNNLRRRTGAIVFSSSGGGELSYESDRFRNGLFTGAIIGGISGKADANSDGKISTDELRAYVSKTVLETSGGRQHPTVDRDNLYIKVQLPCVR